MSLPDPVTPAAPEVPPLARSRGFATGAAFASVGLVASAFALGLNSIVIGRLLGPDGNGIVALSTQVVVITTLVFGLGLRTSVAYRIAAGIWSPHSAARGVLRASLALGLIGAGIGFGAYLLMRHSAMREFNPAMAASLMAALPLALVWWIGPAIPLALERFEEYALLTAAGPVAVLVLCPIGAAIAGSTGTVVAFAGGFAVGGVAAAVWAVAFSRAHFAETRDRHATLAASGFGLRAWVNDLFQFINVRPDLFILTGYYGAADAGVYAVAISITALVWVVSQPLASVVLPRAAGLGIAPPTNVAAGDPHVSAVRHAVLVCVLAVIATVLALALAPLVWGPGFGDIPTLGYILLPGVALLGVARVMVAAFTGHGAVNRALLIGLVSFPLTLVAFLIVIPGHGSTGAAVVSSCSYVVTSALAALFFFRATGAGARECLLPRRADLRDYLRLARTIRARIASSGRRADVEV